MEIWLCYSSVILGRHHINCPSLVLADRCRSGVGIDHRWYWLLSDLIFFITLRHSEHLKVSRLCKVTGVTKLFIAGWWSGCSKSEFSMVIVAGRLRQLHDHKPCFRHFLSAAQGCAFTMHFGTADSEGCPVVAESEALSAFAAQDLRVRERAEFRAFIVIGLASSWSCCYCFGGLTICMLCCCSVFSWFGSCD